MLFLSRIRNQICLEFPPELWTVDRSFLLRTEDAASSAAAVRNEKLNYEHVNQIIVAEPQSSSHTNSGVKLQIEIWELLES